MVRRSEICVLAVCYGASLLFAGTNVSPDLQSLAEPRLNESEELRLIGRVRAAPPSQDEVKAWAQIVNSTKYSDARRGRALLQLFDRHVHPDMTLSQLANLLAYPSWIVKGDLELVTIIAGNVPIDIVAGQTVFVIRPNLTPDLSAVYLRVQGTPSRDSIYDALQGKKSDASTLKITAMAIFCTAANDKRLITHSVEEGMKERLKASRRP